MNRAEIEQRLDALGELLQQTILRAELRKQLGGILDVERLLAKVTLGSAGPRDVLALGRSLEKIPGLKRCFDTQQAARLRSLHDRLDELPDVTNLILEAISDEPPLNLVDGETIRAGYHPLGISAHSVLHGPLQPSAVADPGQPSGVIGRVASDALRMGQMGSRRSAFIQDDAERFRLPFPCSLRTGDTFPAGV